MKIADKLLSISPENASSENPSYNNYRHNIERFKVTGTIFLGGLAARMTGVDVGEVAGIDVAGVANAAAMAGGFFGAYVTGFMAASDAFELSRRMP